MKSFGSRLPFRPFIHSFIHPVAQQNKVKIWEYTLTQWFLLLCFGRARALSTKFNNDPERSSRPFDKDRDGFVYLFFPYAALAVWAFEQLNVFQRGRWWSFMCCILTFFYWMQNGRGCGGYCIRGEMLLILINILLMRLYPVGIIIDLVGKVCLRCIVGYWTSVEKNPVLCRLATLSGPVLCCLAGVWTCNGKGSQNLCRSEGLWHVRWDSPASLSSLALFFKFSQIIFVESQSMICCKPWSVWQRTEIMDVIGWTGDAYHITQPSSEGRGAILAMTRALRQVCWTVFSMPRVQLNVICDTGPCQAPPLNLFSVWHLCILSSWSNDASLKKRVLGCAGWVATGGDWLYQCTCYINTTRSLGLCQLTYLWWMLWWAWWGLVPLWSLILCFMKSLLLFMTDLLHASSGDVVEARAIQAVFKEHASCSRLAFSSTKVWSRS